MIQKPWLSLLIHSPGEGSAELPIKGFGVFGKTFRSFPENISKFFRSFEKSFAGGASKLGFRGRWRNAENIGKTEAEVVAMWNAAHPDDPIEAEEGEPQPG